MIEGLQFFVPLFRREAPLAGCSLTLRQSGRTVARELQGEGTESDGDAARRSILRNDTGRMPDPLQFAVPRRPAVRMPVLRGENRHGE